MTNKALRDYAIAVGTILLGGVVWKTTKSAEVTAALVGAGGLMIGRLVKQPDYAKNPAPPEKPE